MKAKALTTEGWIAILGLFLTLLGGVLNAVLPPEYQDLAEWILLGVQSIGMILILIFVRQTVKLLAKLEGR